MYLKKVVLDGFKSFYTRTEIDFSDDITCIVGPNGCGKSNILDAVRWVLGEQSAKQLRGQEISDLISAGNARKNEKNRAEAYLTFAGVQDQLDTERDEVEVGRIVDRDGSGTYLLNGDEVRLKDIKDMFRDTGIGQDLYSIIGQGEVVRLIESKPEERREIIEEAAGIATFRHRRDLTRKRLKKTREELETVDKELREKQGRLSQLKGQAEKARTVRDLQRTLRECRFEKRRREYHRIEERMDELEDKQSEAKKTFKKAQSRKSEVQETLERSEERLQDIRRRVERLESRIRPLEQEHQDTREALSRIETRRHSVTEQIQRDRSTLTESIRERERLFDEFCDMYRDRYENRVHQRIKQSHVELLEDVETAVRRRAQSLRDELENIRSRSLFEISEESEIKHRLNSAEEDSDELDEQRLELEQDLREQCRRVARAESKRREHLDQFFDAEAERVRLSISRSHRIREREALSTLNDELEEAELRVRQKTERLSNRESTLEQFIDNYEGFYPGVREIMSRVDEEEEPSEWQEEVEGVLANLMTVDDHYKQAVESVLERRVQSIVVQDRRRVREMIDYLNEEEAGSARFLPLDSMENGVRATLPDDLEQAGDVRRARRVVQVDGPVGDAVSVLLNQVLIADSFDRAEALRERLTEHDGEWTIVTVRGERVSTNGEMVGGAGDSDSLELLNRDDELDELRERLERLQRRRRHLNFSMRRIETMQERLTNNVDRISNAIQGIQSETEADRGAAREATGDLRSARDRYDNLCLALSEVIEQSLETDVERTSLEIVMETVENRESDRKNRTQQLRNRLRSAEERLENVQRRIRERVRAVEECSSRGREINNRLGNLEDRKRTHRRTIRSTNEDIEQSREQWFQLERRRVRRALERDRLSHHLEGLRDLKSYWADRRNDHQDRLRSLNRDLQEAERTTEKARGERDRLRNERENEEARQKELIETLREDHEVEDPASLEAEAPEKYSEMDWDELTETIRETQSEVRSIQPVNMLAEKELEGLEEEVESVSDQKEDLEESCQQLERMIRRLNDRARSQFKEAFEEIQGYFEDFASELFNGGEGRLELTDDPVLEAGVTLEIQPPGEQLKSMAALSGGEKTLTALAFLFALFERKATPFAFLDEVDAPFDDENVAKFIQLLKRYGDRTQFVIITHNKATMQAASQLYGVTMEESGVSSLVSVELEEAESLREQPRRATS